MISKYYILKNSVYFRKRIEAGSVDAAEQERESAARRRLAGELPEAPVGPSPSGQTQFRASRSSLLSLLRKPGAATGGGGGSRQHTPSRTESGHLALNSSLNPWHVPRRRTAISSLERAGVCAGQ